MKNVKQGIKKLGSLMILMMLLLSWTPTILAEEQEPSMMDLVEKAGYQVSEADRPASIILIDANTGKYLWGENPDLPRNPASIMKVMTLYLVYEAMEQGKFDLETTVTGTNRYQGISEIYALSNSPIVAGVEYPVKDLIPMVLVPSSNVATLMLAELVDPNPVTFLEKMNEKARALGMAQTAIYNATGAQISAFEELYVPAEIDGSSLSPWEDNSTTARDLSMLMYHLLHNYPEMLDYTATPQYTAMVGTPYEVTFDSYNYSLPGLTHAYEGVDGLKTGSSGSGGFNIAMTAKRGDLRLIAIVLGVGVWGNQEGEYLRHPFGNAALEYGFSQFEYRSLLAIGEQEVNGEKVVLESTLYDTVKKESELAFQVEEDRIGLTQPLPRVSETIDLMTVPVTPVETPVVVAKEFKEKIEATLFNRIGLNSQLRWKILIGIGAFLLLLLTLFVSSLRTKQKRRRARQNRGRK